MTQNNLMSKLQSITILSWLCAMVGYDKVIQAFSQFKK